MALRLAGEHPPHNATLMLTAEERTRVARLLEDAGGKDICVADYEGASIYVNRPGVRVSGLRDDITLNLVLFGRNVSVLRNNDGSALLLLPPRPSPPPPSKGFWQEIREVLLGTFLVVALLFTYVAALQEAGGDIRGIPGVILEWIRLSPCTLERFTGWLESPFLHETATAFRSTTGVVCPVWTPSPVAAPPGSTADTTRCFYDAATGSVSCY